MAWFSLLPEHLGIYEVWLVRLFLLLGFISIGPWLVILGYDVFLYSWRSVAHEIPVVGGKARGRQRPRAPSLSERPSGRPRSFSITGSPAPLARQRTTSPKVKSPLSQTHRASRS